MIKSNKAFDALNNLRHRKPIFILRWPNLDLNYFSTGIFNGISENCLPIIKSIEINWPDPKDSDFPSEGEATVVLNERISDHPILDILMYLDPYLAENYAVIRYGFAQLEEDNFVKIFQGYIKDISVDNYKYTLKFSENYFYDKTKKRSIIQKYGRTAMRGTHDKGATEANAETVEQLLTFCDEESAPWGIYNHTWVHLSGGDEEIIRYTNRNENAVKFEWAVGQKYKHEDESIISEVMQIRSNRYFEALMNILETNKGGRYDVGISNWGLEVPENIIDWIQIRNTIYGLGPTIDTATGNSIAPTINYIIPEKEKNELDDGWAYVKNNILEPLGIWLQFKDGKLVARSYDIYSKVDKIADITQNDIKNGKIKLNYNDVIEKGILRYKRWKDGPLHYYGRYDVQEVWKWKDIDLSLSGREVEISSESFFWDLIWPDGVLWNHYIAQDNLRRRMYLYGYPFVTGELTISPKYILLEPSDIISITYSKFVNFENINYGWQNILARITEKTISFDKDKFSLEIKFETNYAKLPLANWPIIQIHSWDNSDLEELEDIGKARQIIQFNSDASETLQSYDGFLDQDDYYVTYLKCKLQITPPNNPSGNDYSIINIRIHAQDPEGTTIKYCDYEVTYCERDSEPFIVDLSFWIENYYGIHVWRNATLNSPDRYNIKRIKIDWYDSTCDEPPTEVKLVGVTFVDQLYEIESEFIDELLE